MSRYCWKSILPPVGVMLNFHQLDSCVLLSGSNDRWTHFSNMRYCFANLEKELSLCFQSGKIWSHSPLVLIQLCWSGALSIMQRLLHQVR